MLFSTRNNVPDIYMTSSRDFQLFGAILDSIYNYLISNQLKINYIDDLEIVDAKLLPLISKYLGFFTNMYYPEDLLRAILMNFSSMVKNKGSKLGIEIAVKALQNAFADITFVNVAADPDIPGKYNISTDGVIINQAYIDEVLSYVLPIGAIVDQFQILQDINTLKPELFKNTDKPIGLFFDSSDSSDYWVQDGDIELLLGSIRNSAIIENQKHNLNKYFSKIGQTPIVKKATKGVIHPKSV